MPRSSRSKSHKQSKHSSKDYSGSDEDVKTKERSSNGGKEDVRVSVRVSKEKHGKDVVSVHGNGGSDRWSSDDKGLVINEEDKEVLKSKSVGDSKSKSSRKHDVDSERSAVLEKDSNRGDKRKSEKESGRKESSQYKEHKESKDRERGSDKRKAHTDKHEAEAPLKLVENHSSKKGKEITEWSIEEELRNPELEKELEKRMRRRGEASTAKDKYQDIKESEEKQLSTRNDRSKDERHKSEEYGDIKESRKKDEKHREDGERDRKSRDVKHQGESGKYSKHKDDKYFEDRYIEDGNKETKYKDDKYMETSDKDERSRDRKRRQDDDRDYKHKEEKRARDSKRSRDDNDRKTNNRDGSPVYDDRAARYKDDRKRGYEKDDSGDYRSRSSVKERPETEKRSSAKAESASEWGRSGSRYADVEIASNHSRRRSSPSSTRDHHRVSKQEENKYRDYPYEDRARHNAHSSKDYNFAPGQSDKKVTSKDDGYAGGDLSGEKQARPESPPSTSNERRNLIKTDARKSLDLEEPGPRTGGSKENIKDGKGSRELANEGDNDNLSVSSPYTRNSHYSGNTKSHLPPPSPSPSVFEDDRSKPNNRHRRMVDPNINRGQSQSQSHGNWNNNVSNWPSPMVTGGYIPFQHVPPPMFHPLMPQFPPQIFGRPPMKVNPGLPYHVPDHSRPPSLHGWDANNAVFGDESHLYGRLDWDHRTQMSNRGWDQSGMEVQSGQQKDGYLGHRHDENWSGPTSQPDEGEQNQPDILPETLNLDKNRPETQKVTESPQIFVSVKEINNTVISEVYLSRVDVSKDLTQPELYEECINMIDSDQEASFSDEFDCKILFLEEGVDVDVIDSASLFSVTNDSVFQKAMLLYKKQKEEFDLTKTYKEKGGSDDDKSADELAAEVDREDSKENDDPLNKPEEPTNMEVDHAVVKQEEEDEPLKQVEEDDSKSASDEKNDGGGVVSTAADVAVTPRESVEFGSVNLNRIHHHSPESTH